jgi:hypothetical protein
MMRAGSKSGVSDLKMRMGPLSGDKAVGTAASPCTDATGSAEYPTAAEAVAALKKSRRNIITSNWFTQMSG